MKKAIFTAALAVIALVMFVGCSEEPGKVVSNPVGSQDLVRINGANCATLFAGQSIVAGTVCVTVDNNANDGNGCLNVRFQTTNGWQLIETHLWGNDSLSTYPQTRGGNPVPGQFPYASGDITGATDWEYCIPLSVFNMNAHNTQCDPVTAYIAAHAALRKVDANGNVIQTETGWGGGTRFVTRGSWATWFSVSLECYQEQDPPPPPVATCETAFGRSSNLSTCFIGTWTEPDGDVVTFGESGNGRWGWTNGPLAPGSYTFDVYAGAAHCDISGLNSVGTVTVQYDGSQAIVSYQMNAGFTLSETQVYADANPLALNCTGGQGPNQDCGYTLAPGQYGNIHNLSGAVSDSHSITGLSGNIYVVAHAVVCSNNW